MECSKHGCFELDIRLLIRTHSNITVFWFWDPREANYFVVYVQRRCLPLPIQYTQPVADTGGGGGGGGVGGVRTPPSDLMMNKIKD